MTRAQFFKITKIPFLFWRPLDRRGIESVFPVSMYSQAKELLVISMSLFCLLPLSPVPMCLSIYQMNKK